MRYNSNNISILLICILGLLSACTPSTKNDTNILSVTHSPQKYFLDRIVGDKYTVNTVISPGENPESMDLTPSQIIALSKSKAYFKIGFLDIENILVEKAKNNNPELKIFECSAGIDIIKEEHTHYEENANMPHSHADGDPHTWSSPKTAKIIAENMYQSMISIDSLNVTFYTDNYIRLKESINKKDSIIKSYLNKADTKAFLIYHPALSYFAEEYGLEQLSIEYEGKQPSPSHLKSLIDVAKEKNIKVVFIQREFDIKNAETIAKTIGAKTIVIDLLSYDWDKEMIKIAKAIAGADE